MKKSKLFVMGMAVIALTFILVLACNNPSGPGGGPASLGESFTITGQVYTEDDSGKYDKFSGSLTVTSIFGNGKIEGGQLTIEIRTPDVSDLQPVDSSYFDFYYRDPTVSPSSLKFAFLDLMGGAYNKISRESKTGNSTRGTYEEVTFIYVDADAVISLKGKTNDENGTSKDTKLSLKAGWNTLYTKMEGNQTSYTITMSISNPNNLKWVLSS